MILIPEFGCDVVKSHYHLGNAGSLVVLTDICIRLPYLYDHSIDSSGLRQEVSSRAITLLKVTHQGQDVLVDPALVGHVVNQVSDQMDSHTADLPVLEG